MNLKCRAFMQIHAARCAVSSKDLWLYVDFELPFLPVKGMTILVKEEIELDLFDYGRYSGGDCSISYDVEEKKIKIYLEYMPDEDENFAEIVDNFLAKGWQKE